MIHIKDRNLGFVTRRLPSLVHSGQVESSSGIKNFTSTHVISIDHKIIMVFVFMAERRNDLPPSCAAASQALRFVCSCSGRHDRKSTEVRDLLRIRSSWTKRGVIDRVPEGYFQSYKLRSKSMLEKDTFEATSCGPKVCLYSCIGLMALGVLPLCTRNALSR